MTNFEKIKSMSIEELANFLVRYREDANYDCEYGLSVEETYTTSDGSIFEFDEKEDAIKYEIDWLITPTEKQPMSNDEYFVKKILEGLDTSIEDLDIEQTEVVTDNNGILTIRP